MVVKKNNVYCIFQLWFNSKPPAVSLLYTPYVIYNLTDEFHIVDYFDDHKFKLMAMTSTMHKDGTLEKWANGKKILNDKEVSKIIKFFKFEKFDGDTLLRMKSFGIKFFPSEVF